MGQIVNVEKSEVLLLVPVCLISWEVHQIVDQSVLSTQNVPATWLVLERSVKIPALVHAVQELFVV